MIHENLYALRKINKLTQEEVADKIGVSRQALAKWENGETLPDIEKSSQLAELYHVSLDDLVHYSSKETGLPIPPKGKYVFGMVSLNEQGQITLPDRAREIFSLEKGDQLLLLGDEKQGLALVKEDQFLNMIDHLKGGSFYE